MFQRIKYCRTEDEPKRNNYYGPGNSWAMSTSAGGCVYFTMDDKRARISRKDAATILRGCRTAFRVIASERTISLV